MTISLVDFCKKQGLYLHEKATENIIQRSAYIEDGWFIITNKENTEFKVFEIPLFGGEESLIDTYETIEDAYNCAMELC